MATTAMATKRKRGDYNQVIKSPKALRELLNSTITTYESAEIALLHIMGGYDFSLSHLQQIFMEDGLAVSFSQVKYKDVAPFVSLDPFRYLRDIHTFELHRSRIPTALFKSIIQDMDMMMVQYGPLPEHEHEEATSRFLSPIFNHLIAQFDFAFRNLLESVIEGRISTKGRIEYYFRAFGSVSILIIEIKLKVSNDKERLDAIAQVIAECDACDWNNSQQNFAVPVYGILCDGESFQFFQFDGSTTPHSFLRGCFPGDPRTLQRGLRIQDFTQTDTAGPFIRSLRTICETIFDLLLLGYISSVQAYRDRSASLGIKLSKPRKSLDRDKWDEAVKLANDALEMFRNAETNRQNQDIAGANETVQEGLTALKLSIEAIPIVDKTDFIMNDWNDDEVEGC